MAGRNDEFMESYKRLDKICREMFHNEKGVTTYIDEMETKGNVTNYISSWNTTLYKLKEYRHIRNTYVHEVGTSILDICTVDDINWLDALYEDIMQSRDPLAQYRKLSEQKGNKRISKSKENETPVARETTSIQEKKYQKIDLFMSIFAAIAIAGILLFLIFLVIILLII